jgi:hypothetical protein
MEGLRSWLSSTSARESERSSSKNLETRSTFSEA